MSNLARLFVSSLFFIVICPCAGYAYNKVPASTITVQLSWKYQFEFAQVIAAYEKGFYKDEGLNVKIIEGGPGIDPIEQVINGEADFGIFSSALVVNYAKGKPLVALAALMQHSAVTLIARHNDQIQNIYDIEGKTIALSSDTKDEILLYLKGMGLKVDNINVVNQTAVGLANLVYADAFSAYISNEGYDVLGKGDEYHVFYPRTSGVDLFGNILFTTRSLVERDSDQVKAFIKATLRGLEYSLDHTGEIVDIILTHYNTQEKDRNHLIYEAKKILELTRPDIVEPGYMSQGRWKHVVEVYKSLGKIKSDIDLGTFIYNPNPSINLKPYYWMLSGLALLLTVMFVFLLQTRKYNASLRTEIGVRKEAENQLRIANQEAEFANQSKSRFLSSMSHELRTPLNSILGFSQIIKRSDNCEGTKQNIQRIIEAGNLLLEMISGLLNMSKIESGKIDILCEQYCVNNIVDECLSLIKPLANNRSITINNSLDQSYSFYVKIDKKHFKQILLNIMSNAVKYNLDNGFITISGKIENRDRYCLSIKDTGKGLSEEQQIDLFKPFERLGAENSNIEGTGLGLSIAKQLIELMEGKIMVKSTFGHGTCFSVVVPFIRKGIRSMPDPEIQDSQCS